MKANELPPRQSLSPNLDIFRVRRKPSQPLSFLPFIPRLRLPLRLELIPRPNELGRDVAILNLRRGHPLPPRRAPKIDNVEVIPFSAIIEGYRAPERQCAVVLQLRLEDGLMIANGHEFRRVRSQPYRAAGGGARDEPHVHDVERSQSQGFEHPPGEEDEVVRRSEVDGPPDGAGQGRRRGVVMLVGGEGNAGGGHALDAGYLEQPRHLCVCSATTCVRGSFRHTAMKRGGGDEASERYASVGNQISDPIDPSDPTTMRNRGVPKKMREARVSSPPREGRRPTKWNSHHHTALSACIDE